MKIKVKLARELKKQNRTMYWLADVTNLSYGTIHRLAMNKAATVSLKVLEDICNALKCELSDILESSIMEVQIADWNGMLHRLTDMEATNDLDISEEDDYSEYNGRYIEYKTYRKLEDQHNELIDKNSELELKLEKLASSIEKVKKILES